jgi:hypothetical protein
LNYTGKLDYPESRRITMRRKKTSATQTQHALLVILGEYAQSLGLVSRIMSVPCHQKKQIHSTQRKVLELLVATLAGLPYLQDISRSAHPLDQDLAVAEAWGQSQWADYSGVSRASQALSQQEVQGFVRCLQEISQPFIDDEVDLAIQREGRLTYDGDLTGLPVSKSSTTYPEVAFGHMDETICLGYQSALVSLRSPTYGRLGLSIEHHPGNTVSSQQAAALVQAAEVSTGRRPWRRVDLLEGRLKAMDEEGAARQKHLEGHQQKLAKAQTNLVEAQQQAQALRSELAQIEQDYLTDRRVELPTSQLAQCRKRVQVWEKRTVRWEQKVDQAAHLCQRSQGFLSEFQTKRRTLQDRLERFWQENRTNPHPVQAIFRLDAGFGTWENVALLIELGYEVYTKANNHMTVEILHKSLVDPQAWQPVGEKAEMQSRKDFHPENFCYPVDVGLERFQHSPTVWKQSLLLHFGSDPVANDCKGWFDYYNGRQSIEAWIKEDKHVFFLHHIKVRSIPAIILQEAFVLFASNFIRWASVWIEQQCAGSAKKALDLRTVGTKRLVQVMAHTSAEVSRNADICLVRFNPLSCLAGKELRLPGHSTRPEGPFEKVRFFHVFRRFLE